MAPPQKSSSKKKRTSRSRRPGTGSTNTSSSTSKKSQRKKRGPRRKSKQGKAPAAEDSKPLRRVMLINVSKGEECRIAIVHEGKLEEIYFERHSSGSYVGNIYKGLVTNVEPSIQAAFIDFGIGKNGFLHISDLQPQYFPEGRRGVENVGRKMSRRDRPPIQACLKRQDEIIVQVTKEGIGTKGPTLTTYLSLPGRYLVMMPGMSKLGVSRRIEDFDSRKDMRDALNQLPLPADMGFILRTAGLGKPKRDLQRDLNYLSRLWKMVCKRIKSVDAPATLYRESDLVVRTIRDVLTSDFDQIIIDDAETATRAKEFLRLVMPRSGGMIQVYKGDAPLFHKYDIEREIERIYSKHVPLPSGGSLVIEQTEALVAIDVNSGKYRDQDNAEATAHKINLEAAVEIARQLRLRDLGGLIICDFIDMNADKHRRDVERTLRDALKDHKEKVQILRMSRFGIIEMTRQRHRLSIKSGLFEDCSKCRGSGLVKTPESLTLDVMRLIQLKITNPQLVELTVTVAPEVGFHLLNRKRAELTRLESQSGKKIRVRMGENGSPERFTLEGVDARGQLVKIHS